MTQEKFELCPIIDKNRNQSYADIVTTWHDNYHLHENICPKMPKCKRSIYKMDLSATDHNNFHMSELEIKSNNPNILTIIDDYSIVLLSQL